MNTLNYGWCWVKVIRRIVKKNTAVQQKISVLKLFQNE